MRTLQLGEMKAKVTQLEAAEPRLKLRLIWLQSPCFCHHFTPGRKNLLDWETVPWQRQAVVRKWGLGHSWARRCWSWLLAKSFSLSPRAVGSACLSGCGLVGRVALLLLHSLGFCLWFLGPQLCLAPASFSPEVWVLSSCSCPTFDHMPGSKQPPQSQGEADI